MQELGTESPLNINLDQFNRAVYEVALTGVEHELPQINKAAQMWRNEFDRLKDQAVALNLLPEDVTVPNAANYIMVMYNKNKIIDEGGKAARGDGTFAQHVFDQFQASNETVKMYLESPQAQALLKSLEDAKKEIQLHTETLKRDVTPRVAQLSKEVKRLKSEKQKAHPSSHADYNKKISKASSDLEKAKIESMRLKDARKPVGS